MIYLFKIKTQLVTKIGMSRLFISTYFTKRYITTKTICKIILEFITKLEEYIIELAGSQLGISKFEIKIPESRYK